MTAMPGLLFSTRTARSSSCQRRAGTISPRGNMAFEIVTHSPAETQELGRRIGELARPGDAMLLTGELGAGKTCLTQGVAWGLGIEEYALSPTLVIMRGKHGRLPLYHMDLY